MRLEDQTKCECMGCTSNEVCKKEIRIDIEPKRENNLCETNS